MRKILRLNGYEEYIARGADFAVPTINGWTSLIAASSNGHIKVVRLLLERGADLAVPNKYGMTPLYKIIAVVKRSCESQRFLTRIGL